MGGTCLENNHNYTNAINKTITQDDVCVGISNTHKVAAGTFFLLRAYLSRVIIPLVCWLLEAHFAVWRFHE